MGNLPSVSDFLSVNGKLDQNIHLNKDNRPVPGNYSTKHGWGVFCKHLKSHWKNRTFKNFFEVLPNAVKDTKKELKQEKLAANIKAMEIFGDVIDKKYKKFGVEALKALLPDYDEKKPLTRRKVEQTLERAASARINSPQYHNVEKFSDEIFPDGEASPEAQFKKLLREEALKMGFDPPPPAPMSPTAFNEFKEAFLEKTLSDEQFKNRNLPDKDLKQLGDKLAASEIKNYLEKKYLGIFEKGGEKQAVYTKFRSYSRLAPESPTRSFTMEVLNATFDYLQDYHITNEEDWQTNFDHTLDQKVEYLLGRYDKDICQKPFDEICPKVLKELDIDPHSTDEWISIKSKVYQSVVNSVRSAEDITPALIKAQISNASMAQNEEDLALFIDPKYSHNLYKSYGEVKDRTQVRAPSFHQLNDDEKRLLKNEISNAVRRLPGFSTKAMASEIRTTVKEAIGDYLIKFQDKPNLKALKLALAGLDKDAPPSQGFRHARELIAMDMLGSDAFSDKLLSGPRLDEMAKTLNDKMQTLQNKLRQGSDALALEIGKLIKGTGSLDKVALALNELQKNYADMTFPRSDHDRIAVYGRLVDQAMADIVSRLGREEVEVLFDKSRNLSFKDLMEEVLKNSQTAKEMARLDVCQRLSQYKIVNQQLLVKGIGCFLKAVNQQAIKGKLGPHQGRLSGEMTQLGKGNVNTVFKGEFQGNPPYTGVFKPVDWFPAGRYQVSVYQGIDDANANYHVRNVVVRQMEETLIGSSLLPDCEYIEHEGQLGILMTYKESADKKQINPEDPKLRMDMVKLGFLDAFTGQLDRHAGNYLVQVNSKGDVTGVTGIDNDFCLGKKLTALEKCYGGGSKLRRLPGLVEKRDFDKYMAITRQSLEDNFGRDLTKTQLDGLWNRTRDIQNHMAALEKKGRIIMPDIGVQGTLEEQYLSTWNQTETKALYSKVMRDGNSYLERDRSYYFGKPK